MERPRWYSLLEGRLKEEIDLFQLTDEEVNFVQEVLVRHQAYFKEVREYVERVVSLLPWRQPDTQRVVLELATAKIDRERNEARASWLEGISDQRRPAVVLSVVDKVLKFHDDHLLQAFGFMDLFGG